MMPQVMACSFLQGTPGHEMGAWGQKSLSCPDCGHLASPTSLLGGRGSDSERPHLRPESGLGRGSLRCVGLQVGERKAESLGPQHPQCCGSVAMPRHSWHRGEQLELSTEV